MSSTSILVPIPTAIPTPTPTSTSIISPTPPTTESKAKKARSPNWTPAEEEQLAISWLHVSQLPEFISNQTSETFYARVTEHFGLYSKIHPRDPDQVRVRWSALNTSTLKFSAIYASVERQPPPGTSESDWIKLAKQIYAEQCKGHLFKLDTAWQTLRNAPKWKAQGRAASVGTPTFGTIRHQIQNFVMLTDPALESDETAVASPHGPEASSPSFLSAQRQLKRPRFESEPSMELNTRSSQTEADREMMLMVLKNLEESNRLSRQMISSLDNALKPEPTDLKVIKTSEAECPDELSREILRLMKTRLKQKYTAEVARGGF